MRQWLTIGDTVAYCQIACFSLKTSGSPDGLATTKSSSCQTVSGLGWQVILVLVEGGHLVWLMEWRQPGSCDLGLVDSLVTRA